MRDIHFSMSEGNSKLNLKQNDDIGRLGNSWRTEFVSFEGTQNVSSAKVESKILGSVDKRGRR